MPKRQKDTTERAATTEAELSRIRGAARRYLLAGGPLFRSVNDTDRDEHIAAIRARLSPKTDPAFEQALERAIPSGPGHSETHDAHEDVWEAAWGLVAFEGEAGYLFGMAVGLEVAALTLRGEQPAVTGRQKGRTR
jgi:hypothetical protein